MQQIRHLSDLLELIELNQIHFSFIHNTHLKYITPINMFLPEQGLQAGDSQIYQIRRAASTR